MFLPSVSTYPFLVFPPFLLNRNHSRHTSHIQKEIIKLVNKLYRSGRGNLICFQLSSAIKLDVKTQFNQATGKVTTGKKVLKHDFNLNVSQPHKHSKSMLRSYFYCMLLCSCKKDLLPTRRGLRNLSLRIPPVHKMWFVCRALSLQCNLYP